jgi:glycosyltransferase involved in cell wall biosynthesis
MHVLYFHPNFPAQFGPIAGHLVHRLGWKVSYVSHTGPASIPNFQRFRYEPRGGATEQTHYCSRSFENAIWHSHAVYETLCAQKEFKPDLIVGHSGFGTTFFLRELYDCPIINFFEYFYHTRNSDMDFRPEFPVSEIDKLRARARNAAILLDLENCDAGICPTNWQKERLPAAFRSKLHTIFDGIDTEFWSNKAHGESLSRAGSRQIGELTIPNDRKIVTYVARGMESIRGFDLFMRFAKLLYQRRADVHFVVVGQDRVCYGGDEKFTGGKSFKEWVLAQDSYDLSRFSFLGNIPPNALAKLLSITDLHAYWTVPFVLSWSLLNALSCGAVVLASDTPPVREVIQHEKNGMLVDFFDTEKWAALADVILAKPESYRPLGIAGRETVLREYSYEVCLPKLVRLYEDVVQRRR